ncbi:MAG: response regulator [Patescibacteria group bacterium]|nr:response regulator [Patescibacteria group bacterium]MDD5567498.1 response regulator [Patescibacteria group bacterium]
MAKVLVVEDEAFLSQALSDKLRKSGYEVETAMDGEMGLEKIRSFKPEVVLLDLLMPKKNGYAVLDEIKKDKTWKNLPIIVLSNFGEKTEIKKAKDLGAKDYYVKANVKLADLVNKIKRYLPK